MAKQATSTPARRKPRILWANTFCLLDTSSGASMSVREMLRQLVKQGYEVQILGCTVFDSSKGAEHLREQWAERIASPNRLAEIPDGDLTHQLIVTRQTQRLLLSAVEEDRWFAQYRYLLDHFKPDLVWYYGGQTLDLLIPNEARIRGVPSAFYLANGNYQTSPNWCRDIDLILTDSQSTANLYRDSLGIVATPVGKFIDPERFVAKTHERNHLLFISPSEEKGVSIVIQLALLLEQRHPDITLEVVEARGNWPAFLKHVSGRLGTPRERLENVRLTANTDAMHAIYARARVLLAPSLWWESGARVLAEAMLNGIPAIVSNRGGSPGLIEDGGVVLDFPAACYEKPYQHLLSEEELEPLYQAVIAYFDDQARYDDASERAFRVGRDRHHIDVSTRRLTQALAPLINQRAGDKDFLRAQRQQHKHKLTGKAAKPDFSKGPDPISTPEPAATSAPAKVQLRHADPTASAAPEPTASTTPVSSARPPAAAQATLSTGSAPTGPAPDPATATQATFDWQLQGRVLVLDNRAKLLRSGAWDSLRETDAFSLVAFDPASEVQHPEQFEDNEHVQVFRHALLGDGQPATLHACLDPALSSTLKPLPDAQLPAHQRQGARVLATLPISTLSLDSIEGLGHLDWLILDDLSDAIAILEHGETQLQQTLLIQARVAFQPTHERQPSLAELQHWMARHGFRFYRFNDARYHSLFPQDTEASQQLASELQSLETLFIPSDERLAAFDDSRKQKLVFLLHSVFSAHDLAYQVMSQVNALLAKQYLRFVEGQVGANLAPKPAPTDTSATASAAPAPTPAAASASPPAPAHSDLSPQDRKILATFKARATPHEPLEDGEKGLFIDCGGYDGCSAIKFRINNPAFDCVTFEPNPTLWPYYDGLPTQLIKQAAFTYNGEIKFTQDNIDEDGSSVVRRKKIDFTGQKKNSQFPTIKVDCIDLAEFIQNRTQTDQKLILKLDVEGAEYDILDRLIEQDLLRHISKLHCEFHWQKCGISQQRHEAVVAKIEETTEILDWDALDFSVHKRGEQAKQFRQLVLSKLVHGGQKLEARKDLNELVLHIGMHRTGTTTLQEKFFPQVLGFQGRSKLKYGGWGYDECSKSLLAASKSQDKEAFQQFLDCAKNQADLQDIQRLIFSNEALLEPADWSIAPFTANGKKSRMVATSPAIGFLEQAVKHYDGRIKIIFVVRNQADWLASFYSRVSSQIQTASQEDFERQVQSILKNDTSWIDWEAWVTCLSQIVGSENTLFLPMEMMGEPEYWRQLSVFLDSEQVIYDGSQDKENQYSLGGGTYKLQRANKDGTVQERTFSLTEALRKTVLTDPNIVASNLRLEKTLGISLRQYGYFYGDPGSGSSPETQTRKSMQPDRQSKLLTKSEALASLSGPTLSDFGVELQPLKITSTREVIKKRDELYETTRKTLTELLNELHGERHSERYWDILLHYFLANRFCKNYLSRWNNGILNDQLDWQAITAQFPTRETFEFGPKAASLVGSAAPFISESLTRSGRLAQMKTEKSKILVPKNRDDYNKIAQHFESASKGKQDIGINIGSHSPDYWRGEWRKDGVDLIDLPPFSVDTHKAINWDFRAKIAQLDEDYPFPDCEGLWSSLALCLPCEYVEDYPRLVDLTKQLIAGQQPQVVISTLMGMTSWRFVAALLAEQGVPLHLQQHGGAYGEFPSHKASRIEVRIADRYFTWGWQDKTGKTQPGPEHRFDHLQQTFESVSKQGPTRDEVLVIGAHEPLVPTELKGTDYDLVNLEKTLEYLNALDENKRKSLVYRFRRQHGSSQELERQLIESLPSETRFDFQHRSIAEAYASAREVIIVSPFTTSRLECEHLGIPYVVIHQPSEEFMTIPCSIPEQYEP